MRPALFVSVFALTLSVLAYAQEPAAPAVTPAAPATTVVAAPAVAPTPAPAVAVPETPAAPVEAPAVVKVEGDKVTVNDIVTDAKGVADAVKAYQAEKKEGDKHAARLALMALLAAVFKILLSCVKFTSEFWKGKKGKAALRITTLSLGIVVALVSHFAAGESWTSAIMLGVSGPLAISVHELFDVIVNLVQKKPAEPAK
jgi:hypothetical protein